MNRMSALGQSGVSPNLDHLGHIVPCHAPDNLRSGRSHLSRIPVSPFLTYHSFNLLIGRITSRQNEIAKPSLWLRLLRF
ncbi:hypothetical protein NPIL_448731 [Nephila pilipes]|uniref:Uncharacterized protein n=1 Tax=Nephila pilipes TaxID=299642 RepID=A0A8X6U151_NEPPI|nr:hypothetical protein NPIL_448731 [Nephila pilipes]